MSQVEKKPKWDFENRVFQHVLNQCQKHIQSIMDVPIGTGRFLEQYASLKSVKVYGVDFSDDMLSITSNKIRSENIELIKHDVIAQKLNIRADMTICYRFLNLFEWNLAQSALKNLISATQNYILLAVRTVSEDYRESRFIENKIYLHCEKDVEKLLADHDFRIIKRYKFDDTRAGDYQVIWSQRIQKNFSSRINKIFFVVYTYDSPNNKGKIYQVKDNHHANFIHEISQNKAVRKYFPKINQIIDAFIDVEWVNGDLLEAPLWPLVIDLLVEIQRLECSCNPVFDYVQDLVIPRFYKALPIIG